MNAKTLIVTGTILGCIAVAFGAIGAHMLESRIQEWYGSLELLETWKIGVRYQMYHALALLAIGSISLQLPQPSRLLGLAGIFFLLGVLFFSGSIYLLVLTDVKILGMIAALGGTLQVVGWLLAIAGACCLDVRAAKT